MKTSTAKQNPVIKSRRAHHFALVYALFGAAIAAQNAGAACNPQIPRSCDQPAQYKPHKPYEAKTVSHTSAWYTHTTKPHSPGTIYTAPKRTIRAPIDPPQSNITRMRPTRTGSFSSAAGTPSIRSRFRLATQN